MSAGKIHVDPETGTVGKCSANKRACPYMHFDNMNEAVKASEHIMEKLHAETLNGVSKAYDPVKTPVETDTKLAQAYDDLNKSKRDLYYATTDMHSLLKDRPQIKYVRKNRVAIYEHTPEQTRERLEELSQSETNIYDKERQQDAMQSFDEAQQKIQKYEQKIEKLDAVHQKHNWSRFFIVPDGHIHSSMHCSTCNKRGLTSFSWLPDLSGKTEAKAVEDHGARLCTVCFPSAPVEWTNYLEEEKKKKENTNCPGSRQRPADGTLRGGYGRYSGKCSVCGEYYSVSNTHLIRAHKPPKTKK